MSIEHLLRKRRAEHLDILCKLLEIPSVSADPARQSEVVRCAEQVEALARRCGLETRILATGGHPAVAAWRRRRPDRSTVLIYGHYDVQPEAPVELWTSPPFQPAVRDGKLFARGATDDKGQFLPHLLAVQTLLEAEEELPGNVVFLIEGEEEIGSPHLRATLEREAEMLRADLLLVSDGSLFAPGIPSLVYGMRGACFVQVDLEGPDAGWQLARMVAGLKSETATILVDGFYTDVEPADPLEYAHLPDEPERLRCELGVPGLHGEPGYSQLQQRTVRPTLEVNGFLVEGPRAMVKLTCRLVPRQDPRTVVRQLRDRLEELAPPGLRLEMVSRAGGRPWVTPQDHPALRAAGRALTRAYGRAPVMLREGGTIPIVADFQQLLGLPPILAGFGLTTDNLHAPDEHIHLENYFQAISAAVELQRDLSTIL